MTLAELNQHLKNLGIEDDKFYLHGLYGSNSDQNKISLTIKTEQFTTQYEVYYKERGVKSSSLLFHQESAACEYVLSQLKEELILDRINKIDGLKGMTVNERLYVSGLMDEFEISRANNKTRAAQILRMLGIDESSIKEIID